MKTFNDIINNYVTSPDFLNKNIEDLVMFAYKEGCVDTAFIYDQYGQILEADREEFTKNLNPNGHDYVDLGLPSGTLWATMNIGATSPEQYGDYFAWGETTPKNSYSWNNYKYGDFSTLTKYCDNSDYGKDEFTDNLTELELGDDAARANWGGDWRMPTQAQVQELIDNTTSAWKNIWTNDFNNTCISGIILTSKTNGNTMFIPAAGYKDDTSTNGVGVGGDLWCSALYSRGSYDAWFLLFNRYEVVLNNYYGYRYCGRSVRGVLCGD